MLAQPAGTGGTATSTNLRALTSQLRRKRHGKNTIGNYNLHAAIKFIIKGTRYTFCQEKKNWHFICRIVKKGGNGDVICQFHRIEENAYYNFLCCTSIVKLKAAYGQTLVLHRD